MDVLPAFLIVTEAILGIGFLAWLIMRVLVSAVNYRPPMALITILSLISLTCIVGYIVLGDNRQELVAMGSLAIGALTATLTQIRIPPDKPPDDSPPEQLNPPK